MLCGPFCSGWRWTWHRLRLSRCPWRAIPLRSSASYTPAFPSRSWAPVPSTTGRGYLSRCREQVHARPRRTFLPYVRERGEGKRSIQAGSDSLKWFEMLGAANQWGWIGAGETATTVHSKPALFCLFISEGGSFFKLISCDDLTSNSKCPNLVVFLHVMIYK